MFCGEAVRATERNAGAEKAGPENFPGQAQRRLSVVIFYRGEAVLGPPRRRPSAEHLGIPPALISHQPSGVRRLAWAMPERFGVAAAGAGVGCSRHDKSRSPERHNNALCLIAGPENLEGEVSRHVLRPRHRERQLRHNVGLCRAVGSKAKSQARKNEHRKFCRSPMPAAERSELFSARVCWFVVP